MNEDDFLRSLDHRGPGLSQWPLLRRLAARRLLARSGAARTAHAQALDMAQRLHEALAPEPLPPALRARLLAVAVPRARPAPRRLRWGVGLLAASGLASLAGGFLVGASGVLGTTSPPGLYAALAVGPLPGFGI